MKQLVMGLVGGGRIGKMHALNLINSVPEARVKTIADPSLEEVWLKDLEHVGLVRESQLVFDDPEIEAVLIAAPTTTHVDLIKDAAKAGKHIFCEKPIDTNPARIQEAIDAADSADVQLFVGFNRRFDANFMKIKRHVDEGDIGQIQIVKITNRDPRLPPARFLGRSGGIFMDFTVHDFDMARFITGSEGVEVSVMGAAFHSEIEEAGDLDTAIVNLKMANGALVSIDNSRQALYGYDQRLEVFGSKGSVSAENETPTRVVLSTRDAIHSDKPYFSFIERYHETYITEIKEFIRYILEKKDARPSGQEALQAVRLAIAAKQSLEEKRTIILDP
ncbi:MAG: inositol 2-dehydrogenase [SAR324 cluster bacterium]|nr:inositol 2-dehydrogenase [SAR324 cluster bacterium]